VTLLTSPHLEAHFEINTLYRLKDVITSRYVHKYWHSL